MASEAGARRGTLQRRRRTAGGAAEQGALYSFVRDSRSTGSECLYASL